MGLQATAALSPAEAVPQGVTVAAVGREPGMGGRMGRGTRRPAREMVAARSQLPALARMPLATR